YGYGLNSPLNHTDPTGQDVFGAFNAVVGGAGDLFNSGAHVVTQAVGTGVDIAHSAVTSTVTAASNGYNAAHEWVSQRADALQKAATGLDEGAAFFGGVAMFCGLGAAAATITGIGAPVGAVLAGC